MQYNKNTGTMKTHIQSMYVLLLFHICTFTNVFSKPYRH